MFRRVIPKMLAAIGLLMISFQLPAQSEPTEAALNLRASPVTNHTSPVSTIHRVIKESRLYEYLLNHPDFIKIQDMACQVWENQTGNKRRVAYSRKKIYSIKID